jgi:hypothetical protein
MLRTKNSLSSFERGRKKISIFMTQIPTRIIISIMRGLKLFVWGESPKN